MKIRFFDLKTKEDAKLGIDATGFYVDEYGDVSEFVEQGYASFYCHIDRDDVGWEILKTKSIK
jgi:hypothetical protein